MVIWLGARGISGMNNVVSKTHYNKWCLTIMLCFVNHYGIWGHAAAKVWVSHPALNLLCHKSTRVVRQTESDPAFTALHPPFYFFDPKSTLDLHTASSRLANSRIPSQLTPATRSWWMRNLGPHLIIMPVHCMHSYIITIEKAKPANLQCKTH